MANDGLVLIYGFLFLFWMAIWQVVRMYVRSDWTNSMLADLRIDRSLVKNLDY